MPDFQIQPLDLHFLDTPESIASYLVTGPGGPVLIETGPGSTLANALTALAEHGLTPADIRDVLVTHIHLDHAGASGWWARQGARIHVHHVGAPHLVSPERLLVSARRIYGDEMDSMWGEFLAAPEDRVHALQDGDVVEAGGLRFVAHDTPGHARHHMVYQLEDTAFVGDLAGVRRPSHAHLRLPTPPPEFELETWLASVGRMRQKRFAAIYLTHYGRIEAVDEHWDRVCDLLPMYSQRVRAGLDAGLDRDAIVADFQAWEDARLVAEGVDPANWPAYASLGPVGMSVDGILRYWKRAASPQRAG